MPAAHLLCLWSLMARRHDAEDGRPARGFDDEELIDVALDPNWGILRRAEQFGRLWVEQQWRTRGDYRGVIQIYRRDRGRKVVINRECAVVLEVQVKENVGRSTERLPIPRQGSHVVSSCRH